MATKKPAPKNKGGRPTKYSKYYAPIIAELMTNAGVIEKDVAARMGIAESTLNKWKLAHPEFAKALKRGRETPKQLVEGALLKRAIGYDAEELSQRRGKPDENNRQGEILGTTLTRRHIPGDTGAIVFYLINQFGEKWKDKKEIAHAIEDDGLKQFALAFGKLRFDNDSG